MRRTGRSQDRGESLIELLVAVMIMGTAVVAVVGGLGTAIMMSDIHRKQAAIAAHLKIFAANIDDAVAATPTRYVDCGDRFAYPDYAPGAPYDADITQVLYWNGSAFVASCGGADSGVQRLTLRVWSVAGHGHADETVDLVIRKPCRPTEATCS